MAQTPIFKIFFFPLNLNFKIRYISTAKLTGLNNFHSLPTAQMQSVGTKRANPTTATTKPNKDRGVGTCDFCGRTKVPCHTVTAVDPRAPPAADDFQYSLCMPFRQSDRGPRGCATCMICPMHGRTGKEVVYVVPRDSDTSDDPIRGLVCDQHRHCHPAWLSKDIGPCTTDLMLVNSFDVDHWNMACSAHRDLCPACHNVRCRDSSGYKWNATPYYDEGDRVDDGELICETCTLQWESSSGSSEQDDSDDSDYSSH